MVKHTCLIYNRTRLGMKDYCSSYSFNVMVKYDLLRANSGNALNAFKVNNDGHLNNAWVRDGPADGINNAVRQ